MTDDEPFREKSWLFLYRTVCTVSHAIKCLRCTAWWHLHVFLPGYDFLQCRIFLRRLDGRTHLNFSLLHTKCHEDVRETSPQQIDSDFPFPSYIMVQLLKYSMFNTPKYTRHMPNQTDFPWHLTLHLDRILVGYLGKRQCLNGPHVDLFYAAELFFPFPNVEWVLM